MLLWERLFSYRRGHQLGTVATGIPAEGEVVGPILHRLHVSAIGLSTI